MAVAPLNGGHHLPVGVALNVIHPQVGVQILEEQPVGLLGSNLSVEGSILVAAVYIAVAEAGGGPRVVHVPWLVGVPFRKRQSWEGQRGETEVVHYYEVSKEARETLDPAYLHVGPGKHLSGNHVVGDTPGRALHDIKLTELVPEADSRNDVSSKIDGKDKHSGEW